jgi:hypothetical protein
MPRVFAARVRRRGPYHSAAKDARLPFTPRRPGERRAPRGPVRARVGSGASTLPPRRARAASPRVWGARDPFLGRLRDLEQERFELPLCSFSTCGSPTQRNTCRPVTAMRWRAEVSRRSLK